MDNEEFIRLHESDDVRQLALKAHNVKGIDLTYCLDQIAGRQTARAKLPSWAAVGEIVYPPHISLEQCSSEQTARYKKTILDRLTEANNTLSLNHSLFIDLTGGMGVDFSFMSQGFRSAVYVERQEHLCEYASHNFRSLNLYNFQVKSEDAEDYLDECPKADVIYLDPARRDSNGAKTFAISDCTPNLLSLLPHLLAKARIVMVKLSPMLDWRKAVADIGAGHVMEVHIVSVDNECKELLILLSSAASQVHPSLYCINLVGSIVSSLIAPLASSSHCPKFLGAQCKASSSFLYEPNASIMKAGCFDYLQMQYEGLMKIAPNSHLFVSSHLVESFLGRAFRIEAVTTMNKQELKQVMKDIDQANITVRNFPLTVAELRKRLKVKDGGDVYIFATTDADNRHLMYICRK